MAIERFYEGNVWIGLRLVQPNEYNEVVTVARCGHLARMLLSLLDSKVVVEAQSIPNQSDGHLRICFDIRHSRKENRFVQVLRDVGRYPNQLSLEGNIYAKSTRPLRMVSFDKDCMMITDRA